MDNPITGDTIKEYPSSTKDLAETKTLRDEFAIHCPVTYLEYREISELANRDEIVTLGSYCNFRYSYADHMLKERNRNDR